MDKRKLGIIVCAHDGISSLYAGVGTAIDGYFRGIDRLRDELEAEYEIRVWAITPWSAPSNCGYSPAQLEKIRRICRSTGGDVLECFNVSDGFNQYGDIENWSITSPTAALLAYQVLKDFAPDDAIVVAACTPFAMMPAILKRHVDFDVDLRAVWIPHNTSLIEERGAYDTKRIEFELAAVESINATPGFFAGYLNPYMREHLGRDYGVQDDKLIPLLNGISENAVPAYPQDEIRQAVEQRGIPADKRIVFMFGRGVHIKGFDIFMRAAAELADLDCHFVLQVAAWSMDYPIVAELKKLQQPNITLLFGLDLVFPKQLMQWDNTDIVAVLSRHEAAGLIPMEVRSYGSALILVSNVGGLPGQVRDGVDGFVTELGVDDVARTMREILSLPETRKSEIAAAGVKLIQEEYIMSKNFMATIMLLLEGGQYSGEGCEQIS
ncbi:glycosyltransferase family 4 protein [Streptomyces scopuliridis]|uniref:glycosyltransferase family 4 protein n=1 Tax=Streptomyces scopuliridis TaxID=452529 RepID=UPI0036C906CB